LQMKKRVQKTGWLYHRLLYNKRFFFKLTTFTTAFLSLFCLTQCAFRTMPAMPDFSTAARMGDGALMLAVASTYKQQYKGLSSLPSIKENQGMLFVFSGGTSGAFIMRDMYFDLDLAFLNKNMCLIEATTMPADNPEKLYHPAQQITYAAAIELPAGWLAKHHIKKGECLRFK